MQEILSAFKSKKTRWQIVICALVFIGMAVPFKVMVLIEGFTEVRPVNAVPVVVGLLFGPAGAWGCAIGNLAADLFGTFSRGSVLGFIGNFIAAWLPYKLWHLSGKRETPNVKNLKNIIRFIYISAVAACATAIFIACGLDVFFDMWMPRIFWIIIINDFGFPLLFGLPFLIVLTSEDSTIEITLPPETQPDRTTVLRGKRHHYLKLGSLVFLLASEACLMIMIALGMQMTVSWLMYTAGGIFIICLLGIALSE